MSKEEEHQAKIKETIDTELERAKAEKPKSLRKDSF